MNKKLIRQLIIEHKTGCYGVMTIRQAYEALQIKLHNSIFNGAK